MKPGPALSQKLGPAGINMGQVISKINEATTSVASIVSKTKDVSTETTMTTIREEFKTIKAQIETAKEKIKIVNEFLKTKKEFIELKNKHEKDALAAALYGLKKTKTLIKKIDDHLKQNNKKHLFEEVKRRVLLEGTPIAKAVKSLS